MVCSELRQAQDCLGVHVRIVGHGGRTVDGVRAELQLRMASLIASPDHHHLLYSISDNPSADAQRLLATSTDHGVM